MLLISGGKTGGHIKPLINLTSSNKAKFIYVGCNGLLEERLCKENQINFLGFPFLKF